MKFKEWLESTYSSQFKEIIRAVYTQTRINNKTPEEKEEYKKLWTI